MTPGDLRLHLYVALAFQSVISCKKNPKAKDDPQGIMELAKHLKEFCDLYVPQAFPIPEVNLVDDAAAKEIDKAIERHIKELRKKEATRLPESKETLLKFYDRLQHRKSRRMQSAFYTTITESKLADLVLSLLDEEIENRGAAT